MHMNCLKHTAMDHDLPDASLRVVTLFISVIVLLFVIAPASMAHGIKFYHSGYEIDKRTSFNVFEHVSPEYADSLNIEFDMANNSGADIHAEMGYVVRIGLGEADDNLIFNLFYDNLGDKVQFRFNQEGNSVLIAMALDRDKLIASHWFRVKLGFNLKTAELRMDVNGESSVVKVPGLPETVAPFITFGRNDYVIDVPAISIDNLHVSGGGKTYDFPLSEKTGEKVHDSSGECVGKVYNAYLLVNDSYKWEKEAEMSSATQAGVCYDRDNSKVYYVNADSIQIYDTATGERSVHVYKERCPVPLFLVNCFVDPESGRLFVYEALHQEGIVNPTIASLDLGDFSWRVVSDEEFKMQLHHHDYFYSPKCKHHVIFGGFGNMMFSNKFYVHDGGQHGWVIIDSLAGNRIAPRYFAAMGYLEDNNSAYVFGGMGNESGEQTVGRRYFYDLYRVDLTTYKVDKLWELRNQNGNTVPARGMVVTDDSTFYVLRYAESISNSTLRLYRFSIADGSFEILSDSIPIKSDKITTNAHLYYNKREGKLVVTVQESPDDVASTLKVYSLAFPPVSHDEYYASGNPGSGRGMKKVLIWAVIGLLAATGAGAWFVFRHKIGGTAGTKPADSDVTPVVPEIPVKSPGKSSVKTESKGNCIYLFGDFTVFNKDGRDVTYMFTARLKQILGLVMQYSDCEGISSSRLSSLIWPDKEKDKVKNSRGVAVNHLRKILTELDGAELRYEAGCFKFVAGENVSCDYLEFVRILADDTPMTVTRRDDFLRIVSRGKFLKNFDEPIFDDFKRLVEVRLDAAVLNCIQQAYEGEEYEIALAFCRTAFNIDPLNEPVLAYAIKACMKLHEKNEARSLYHKFAEEYRHTTGERFAKSFDDYCEA